MDWIIKEFANLSLGDERLNKRSQKVLTQLSRSPTGSIPAGCGSAAETKAAYRFFDNEQVTAEKIHAVHLEATLSRMAEQPVVLLPQDTTVLNFSKQFARKDTGPTTKDAAKGMMLHCAIAVTPEKLCLGVVSTKQWYREKLQHLTKSERQKKDYITPIEDKESYRWLENYKLANEYAAALPNTLIVSISDREGDLYPIYQEANKVFTETGAKAHYLIRAKTDRKVCTDKGKLTGDKIKSALICDKSLGEIVVEVSETKTRKARKAHMNIYSQAIHITVPDKMKKGDNYQPVKITAILCTEHNPPDGSEAIEWLLITDLPVSTFEEACEKIRWYTCRWQIEIFFKILKSGCAVEKIQLTDENFRTCLSFYMIIAWRILYVVIIGRECPDISCECVFSKEEWQTAYVVINKKKPPLTPPTLNEMTRMVASLGGYLNRKSDPEPGVKTMWIGLRNMQEHIRAKEAFEAAYENTCG
jgi:hypothetical protein